MSAHESYYSGLADILDQMSESYKIKNSAIAASNDNAKSQLKKRRKLRLSTAASRPPFIPPSTTSRKYFSDIEPLNKDLKYNTGGRLFTDLTISPDRNTNPSKAFSELYEGGELFATHASRLSAQMKLRKFGMRYVERENIFDNYWQLDDRINTQLNNMNK